MQEQEINPYKLLYEYVRWGEFIKDHYSDIMDKELVRVNKGIQRIVRYVENKYGARIWFGEKQGKIYDISVVKDKKELVRVRVR